MWFFEQRTQLGRWSPVTAPDRPEQRQDGRLSKVGGVGPRIRAIQAIPPHRQHLPLSELQRLYGVREAAEPGQEPRVEVSMGSGPRG